MIDHNHAPDELLRGLLLAAEWTGTASLQALLSRPGLAEVGLHELFDTPPVVAAGEAAARPSTCMFCP